MKRRHKINHGWERPSEPITDAYQREIDRSISKAETKWRRAQKAVQRAEKAAARAEMRAARKPGPETIAARDEARRLVLQRLDELREIEKLMRTPTHAAPAVVHRTGREERLEVGVYRKPKKNSSRRNSPVKIRRNP